MMKVSISLSVGEQKTLDEVLLAVPFANAHALAKLAVRIGLDALRQDTGSIPGLLCGQRLRFTPAADPASAPGFQPVGRLVGVDEMADEVSEDVTPIGDGAAK